MKGAVVFVLAVSVVVGAGLFGSKEEAKQTVSDKYAEAEKLINEISKDINKEKEKREDDSRTQTVDALKKKHNETLEQLKKNAQETTRTAIAKGKFVQTIDCIGTVLVEGEKIIDDALSNGKNAINNVLTNKLDKLNFLTLENKLIGEALGALKRQNLDKIDKSEAGFEAVIADACKKVESAKKQLQEIETRVTKPLLGDEYRNAKKQFENKFKEISDNLLKKLQKCIA